jgi:hypothetical protein
MAGCFVIRARTAGLARTIGLSGVEGFARAARELYAAQNETELLRLAVDLAVRLIDGCDHAGISVVQGRELSTPVAFDDVARRGDTLQYQLREGPRLDVVRWQETVISPNLSEEARWPEWTPRAVSVLGIKAMMSLWLYAGINPDGADSYGVLNLYSDSIDPFGPNEYAIAQVMAAQTSVAPCRAPGDSWPRRRDDEPHHHRAGPGNLDGEARHRCRSSFRLPATGLSEPKSQVDHDLQRDRQDATAPPVITG